MPGSDFLRAIRISDDAVKASNAQDAPDCFAYGRVAVMQPCLRLRKWKAVEEAADLDPSKSVH
jgi:hypothetical protein